MIAAAAGWVWAALSVLVVLAVLRRPLLAVLCELCGGEQRARFWWRVFSIEMVAGTALCGSLAILVLGARADGWRWAAMVVQGSVSGLLVSLGAVMLGVLVFQHQRDRGDVVG